MSYVFLFLGKLFSNLKNLDDHELQNLSHFQFECQLQNLKEQSPFWLVIGDIQDVQFGTLKIKLCFIELLVDVDLKYIF